MKEVQHTSTAAQNLKVTEPLIVNEGKKGWGTKIKPEIKPNSNIRETSQKKKKPTESLYVKHYQGTRKKISLYRSSALSMLIQDSTQAACRIPGQEGTHLLSS